MGWRPVLSTSPAGIGSHYLDTVTGEDTGRASHKGTGVNTVTSIFTKTEARAILKARLLIKTTGTTTDTVRYSYSYRLQTISSSL